MRRIDNGCIEGLPTEQDESIAAGYSRLLACTPQDMERARQWLDEFEKMIKQTKPEDLFVLMPMHHRTLPNAT